MLWGRDRCCFFVGKETGYEIESGLVGSEKWIRDSAWRLKDRCG